MVPSRAGRPLKDRSAGWKPRNPGTGAESPHRSAGPPGSAQPVRAALLLLALVLPLGCDRSAGPATYKHAREVMGTFAEVTAVAADRPTAQRAVSAGYARLDDVNRLMSDYVADSEIGRLNRTPAGTPIVLSPETFACLEAALRVSVRSGGVFDVTCRPYITLWRTAAGRNALPTEAELAAARARVGCDKLRLDPAARSVTLLADGMQVDLGGIAKGYALDLAAAAMKAAGATAGLVDVGGDIVAFGARPDGQRWRIGVRNPFGPGLIATLELTDAAVATSGVQQRFFEIDGRRYSHIIDPRSGRPAHEAPSVTVIAADGTTADAWATVFSVLSVAEGQRLLTRPHAPPVEVMWITGSAEAPVINRTPGFELYLR